MRNYNKTYRKSGDDILDNNTDLKNTNLDLSVLESLSPAEKELALSILKEYSKEGKSEQLNTLLLENYAEVPVDILTFVNDNNYLGYAWHDNEGKSKLYPYWEKELLKIFPDNLTTNVNNAIFSGSRGRGKAQPLTSKIFTDQGYRLMGELKIGDMVYGDDGKTHKILGVFPQGNKKIYELTFTDSSKTRCSGEHLWTVRDNTTRKWKTIDVNEMLSEKLSRNKENTNFFEARYKIPLTNSLEFNHIDTFISPYMMGCLIGDGCFSNSISLTTCDKEILEIFKQELDEKTYIVYKDRNSYLIKQKLKTKHNLYKDELVRLGLYKHKSWEKFIPNIYLYNDVEARLDLLRGLLDTDGTITSDSFISYTTTSEKLANQFIFLVQSLGGTAKIHYERNKTYKNKKGEILSCRDSFTVSLKLPANIIPFKLSRKIARLNPNRLDPQRNIRTIEYVGEEECQCIYIDSESHLYLTDDLIVTHNTEIAVLIAAYLLHRILCLKDPIAFFHLKPTEKIVFAFMNIKKDLAEEIGTAKFQNTIQSSPWFLSHGTIEGRTKKIWVPQKYNNQEAVDIKIGSQADDLIGLPIYFCLDGDTPILTAEGEFKIKDLVDKQIRVFTVDSNNNNVQLSDQCTAKATASSKDAYKITLQDGTVLECTPNHRFMLKDGSYKEAQQLTENDDILEYTPVGYIYKVTNIDTGEFYIGQHKKPIFDKNYYGSGIRARALYNKYGRSKLKIEVIDWAKDIAELNKKEEEYINKLYDDTNNINISKTAVLGNRNPLDWRLRKHLYTNGVETRYFSDEEEIPADYHITNHNKGKVAITDGNTTKFIDLNKEDIPASFRLGNNYTAKKHDMSRYSAEMRQNRRKISSGENNNMYKQGDKVRGERNGHYGKPASELAIKKSKEANTKYIYYFDGREFFGIKELQKYLEYLGYTISDTGVEGLIRQNSRISKKYPNLKIRKELINK